MRYKVGVVKKITFLFMTIGLAIALVACQGAVGKTGEPGPKGEPGDPAPPAPPANLAPQARALVLPAVMLVEEGASQTVNVGVNFFDTDAAEGETLTLVHSGSDASVVRVTLTDGMLTIAPVAAGDTVITVTATDAGGLSASATINVTVHPEGMAPPTYVEGSLPDSYRLMPGQQQVISGADIASAFQEDEGERLTFNAMGSDDTIVLVTQAADDTVTITALATDGDATVTITATDEDMLTVEHAIAVAVRASFQPVAVGMIPAQNLSVGSPSVDVDVSEYFSDPVNDDLTYTAMSSDDTMATADVVDSVVTITPVAAGMVTVTVTATNSSEMSIDQTIAVTVTGTAPTAVGEIPPVSLETGQSTTVDLSPYFMPGEEGDALTYTPSVDNASIVSAIVQAGSSLLIVARMDGTATITVKAMDADGEYASQTIMVTVRPAEVPTQAPVIASTFASQRFAHDDMEPRTFILSDYFTGATSYMPDSSVPSVATAEVNDDEGVLTITPAAAGDTVVTVTAINDAGQVAQKIGVSVAAQPVPMQIKPLPDQTFPADGAPMRIDLSDYFRDADDDDYVVASSDDAIVMAEEEGGVLTLTPVKYGTARVTVTPSNTSGTGTQDTFRVTLQARPEADDIEATRKITVVGDDAIDEDDGTELLDATSDATTIAAIDGGTMRYELMKLITDPDGEDAALTFNTETSDPKVVAVYPTPAASLTNGVRTDQTLTELNKMTTDASDIMIRGRKEGTATITITATDDDDLMDEWTIDVTVIAMNTVPSVPDAGAAPTANNPDTDAASGTSATDGSEFPGAPDTDTDRHRYHDFAILADSGRFLSTGGDAVKRLKVDLANLFVDPDVEINQRTTGDEWEFTATSSDTDVVTVALEPTNNDRKPDERNVVITRVGSGDATITLKVTDSFGKSAMQTFAVKVNHAPMPQGPQDEPKTLGNADDTDIAPFRKLSDAPGAITALTIDLVDYFSDEDTGDVLWCTGNKRGDVTAQLTVSIDNAATERTLSVGADAPTGTPVPDKRTPGVGYLDITCADRTATGTEDMEKAMATLTVEIVKSPDFSVGR